MNLEKKTYVSPKVEKVEFEAENIIVTSAGNGDVGKGRGQGGGCDGEPGHPNQRTFSNGRNSGCNPNQRTFSNGRNSGCN